jgi:hypothetical protein
MYFCQIYNGVSLLSSAFPADGPYNAAIRTVPRDILEPWTLRSLEGRLHVLRGITTHDLLRISVSKVPGYPWGQCGLQHFKWKEERNITSQDQPEGMIAGVVRA